MVLFSTRLLLWLPEIRRDVKHLPSVIPFPKLMIRTRNLPMIKMLVSAIVYYFVDGKKIGKNNV